MLHLSILESRFEDRHTADRARQLALKLEVPLKGVTPGCEFATCLRFGEVQSRRLLSGCVQVGKSRIRTANGAEHRLDQPARDVGQVRRTLKSGDVPQAPFVARMAVRWLGADER